MGEYLEAAAWIIGIAGIPSAAVLAFTWTSKSAKRLESRIRRAQERAGVLPREVVVEQVAPAEGDFMRSRRVVVALVAPRVARLHGLTSVDLSSPFALRTKVAEFPEWEALGPTRRMPSMDLDDLQVADTDVVCFTICPQGMALDFLPGVGAAAMVEIATEVDELESAIGRWLSSLPAVIEGHARPPAADRRNARVPPLLRGRALRFLLTRLADDIDLLSCRVHALRSPDPEVRLEAALGLETPEADAILRDLVQNGWTAKERDVVETFPDLHVLSKDALRAVEVLDDKPAVAAGGKPHVPLKTRVRRSRELTTIKAAAKALNSRLSRAEFVDLLTAAIPPDGQSAAEHPDIEWYRRARRRLTIGLLWVWRERPWPPENPHIDRLRTVAEALLRETHLESELTRDALRLMECVDRSRAATLAMGLMDRGECVEVAASTLGRVGDERAVPSLTAAKRTLPPLDFNAHLAVEHALGEIRGRIHGRPVGSLAVVADPSGEGQLSIAPSPGADPDA